MLGLIIVAALVYYFSCKRYLTVLAYAEHIADKSTCEKCRAYAAFSVTGSSPGQKAFPDDEAQAANAWFSARCRKCGHEWIIC